MTETSHGRHSTNDARSDIIVNLPFYKQLSLIEPGKKHDKHVLVYIVIKSVETTMYDSPPLLSYTTQAISLRFPHS